MSTHAKVMYRTPSGYIEKHSTLGFPVLVLDLSPAACEARLKAVERALKMIEAPERSWMPNSNRAAFILRTVIHPKLGGKK
jgi:hypothetical protein